VEAVNPINFYYTVYATSPNNAWTHNPFNVIASSQIKSICGNLGYTVVGLGQISGDISYNPAIN